MSSASGRGIGEVCRDIETKAVGDRAYALIRELYPICRSITGEGVRQTLRRLQAVAPLQIEQVPSGTRVFDWEIPDEWNIADAWIDTPDGHRLVDFRRHNLHVVSDSRPVRARVSREELLRHLHSLPDQAQLIPYRTAYYADTWGFCVAHALLDQLDAPEYDVCIDATVGPGALEYGECLVSGRTSSEVLISCHICHPSLCNDNLSAIALAALSDGDHSLLDIARRAALPLALVADAARVLEQHSLLAPCDDR